MKELAQEATFIRHEENKIKSKRKITWCDGEFWDLRKHRIYDVRNAARAAQLAYGFLRGVPYRKIEPKTNFILPYYWNVIEKEIKRLAKKFGNNVNFDEEIDAWLKEC